MPRPPQAPYGSGLGLTDVPTKPLRTLLRALHRQQVTCPLTPVALVALGLQDHANVLLGHLRELDRAGVHAVLVAVIAERPDSEPGPPADPDAAPESNAP
jgi:hypothetical protein